MSEQQVTDLLDRATETLPRVGPDLVAGAVRTGRGRRRRHLAATAVAVAAVLGVSGVALGGGSSDRGSVAVATDPTTTPTPTPAPTPSALTRDFGMDPAKTGWVLSSLLEGDVTRERSWHADPGQADDFRAGSVLLDGAQVTVLVERTTLPGCGELPPGGACDSVGDGFMYSTTYEEPASGGGPTGVFANAVTLYTADDFAITATAYNAAAEKGKDPIIERPVLTIAQLTEIVLSPDWLDQHQ
jgi:hypothetical protein